MSLYFLENKLNTKKDVIIFVEADKEKIKQKLKKRKRINFKLINVLRQNQFPLRLKKKKQLLSLITILLVRQQRKM